MTNRNILLVLLIFFLAFVTTLLWAQDKSEITVRRSDVNNGVVIITVQEGQKSLELQCNKGFTGCTVLQAGTYSMVRLPKNWGTYDCANVDIYVSAADTGNATKVGNYCLITK